MKNIFPFPTSLVTDILAWTRARVLGGQLRIDLPKCVRRGQCSRPERRLLGCGGQDAWNPSDYALHLTRRARGLPLWYSLATHGTKAYGEAIATTIATAGAIADGIARMDGLDLLLGPQLSVVLFRPTRMSDQAMDEWADGNRRSGALLCLPTTWHGQKVFRLCIVNPDTDANDVLATLQTLT